MSMLRVTMSILVLTLLCCISSILTGCAATIGPAKLQPANPVAVGAARGVWETVAGPTIPITFPVKIYHYDWYAITPSMITDTVVLWDNGVNCAKTAATIQGSEIHGIEQGVVAVFVIHDAQHATAMFQDGNLTYTKQLEKKKDDPTMHCF